MSTPVPSDATLGSPFFRRLTGAALIVSPLLFAAAEFLSPEQKSNAAAQFDEYTAHWTALIVSSLLSIAVAMTLLLGLLALVRRVHGRGQRFARIGGLVAGYGLVAAHAGLGGANLIFSELARPGADRAASIATLDKTMHDGPVGAPLLLGHYALVVGLVLVAVGLLRAQVAPRWAAWALLAAPIADAVLSGAPGEVGDVVSNALLIASLVAFGVTQLRPRPGVSSPLAAPAPALTATA